MSARLPTGATRALVGRLFEQAVGVCEALAGRARASLPIADTTALVPVPPSTEVQAQRTELLSRVACDRSIACEETVVRELDEQVGALIAAPVPPAAEDLSERVLHKWCAANRTVLFPRTPYLFAYEWQVGSGTDQIQFKGDLLLWDGSHTFTAVECKYLNGSGTSSYKTNKLLSQVSAAVAVAPGFLNLLRAADSDARFSMLAEREALPAPTGWTAAVGSARFPWEYPRGLLQYLDERMQFPRVHGLFVTNRMDALSEEPGGLFSSEHLPESCRKVCQASYDAFSQAAGVVAPSECDTTLSRKLALRTLYGGAARAVAHTATGGQGDPDESEATGDSGEGDDDEGTYPAVEEMVRRGVAALQRADGGPITLTELRLAMLPGHTNGAFKNVPLLREEELERFMGAQDAAELPEPRFMQFKEFLLSEGPFVIDNINYVRLDNARAAVAKAQGQGRR